MKQIRYFLAIIILFCTNLTAQPGPYLAMEGFEDEFFPPTGWEVYNSYWSQSSYSFHSGSNSARIFGEPYNSDWLISPEITLISGTNPFLTYWEYVELDLGLTGEHYVMISTNYDGQGDPNSADWTTLRFSITEINSWNLREIDLNSYEDQSVYIAFYYVGIEDDIDYGSSWFIDGVRVDDFCAGDYSIPNCATNSSPPDEATLYQNFVSFWWNPPFSPDVTEQSIRIWKNC